MLKETESMGRMSGDVYTREGSVGQTSARARNIVPLGVSYLKSEVIQSRAVKYSGACAPLSSSSSSVHFLDRAELLLSSLLSPSLSLLPLSLRPRIRYVPSERGLV